MNDNKNEVDNKNKIETRTAVVLSLVVVVIIIIILLLLRSCSSEKGRNGREESPGIVFAEEQTSVIEYADDRNEIQTKVVVVADDGETYDVKEWESMKDAGLAGPGTSKTSTGRIVSGRNIGNNRSDDENYGDNTANFFDVTITADFGQESGTENRRPENTTVEPENITTENQVITPTEKPTQRPPEKPTQKPTERPTQKPTEQETTTKRVVKPGGDGLTPIIKP